MPHPAPEALIKECEDAIGFSLPESYRKFLLEYGFGGVEDVEYCGLVDGKLTEEDFLNAYWITLTVRQQFQLPSDLLVIRELEDSAVCLLLSQMEGEECPVILWDFSEDIQRQQKKPYILANSFGEYYLQCIQEIIEDSF